MAEEATARRKDSHLDLCARGEVEPAENATLLDGVKLLHCAMPELAVSEVDLSVPFLGKRLRQPLLVTGMTGGTERAGEVNRELARLAEAHGLAFGVGSQRAMSERSELASSFRVRDVAPTVPLLGNIGLMQARTLGIAGVQRLVDAIDADGLALHLNVGQELTQPEGDRDFRDGYALVGALVSAFGDRLLVKETGCGLSPEVARRLSELGVKHLDVSGLGGTSWIRVEQLRASGLQAELGAEYAAWGIPTAAAVALVRRSVAADVSIVASGGMRTGLDVARAIALGADLGGMALPLFRAQQSGGYAGAEVALLRILASLRQACVLTGARSVTELKTRPRVITGTLKDWLAV